MAKRPPKAEALTYCRQLRPIVTPRHAISAELTPGATRAKKLGPAWDQEHTSSHDARRAMGSVRASPVDAVLESVFPDQKYLFRYRSLTQARSPPVRLTPLSSRRARFLTNYCPVEQVPLQEPCDVTDIRLLLNPDLAGLFDQEQLLRVLDMSIDEVFTLDQACGAASKSVVAYVSTCFSRLVATAAESRQPGETGSLPSLLKEACVIGSFVPGTYVLPRRGQPNAVFMVVGAIMIFLGVAVSLLAAVALDYWYNDMPAAYLSIVSLGFIALLLVSVISKLLSEITDFSTARNADVVASRIAAFDADVVVGIGYGCDVVSELVARSKWAGPTLLLAPRFLTTMLGKKVLIQSCGCAMPVQMSAKAAKMLDDCHERSYSLLENTHCGNKLCGFASDRLLESILATVRLGQLRPAQQP
ncbi:hypothetical protein SDRG_03482 [Saprolegnia diclina VS20]|uniref:Uncharacterized protein n=1 Tax=Saprolegnia diclina (strain VS20) TaxID=1156394 RepID=T0QME8_SAPDV|nr:hypothetical protein SDRG_03482 [Saprolegnia diclina VS20]EQC39279.1 hypothetical protein SDRG_03482 [Saprolegnia diclina VS20]|eukprot:XP_008607340.1 hypothetical protein SDRG_03482 [Saprolegnia diclina VS20]